MKVLAPSDEAFANYWKSREAASNDTEDLEPILTYHVLQGVHADTTLDGPPQFITTLLTNSSYTNVTGGQRVEVVSSGGHLKVYSAAKAVSNIVAPASHPSSKKPEIVCAPLTACIEHSLHWRSRQHHRQRSYAANQRTQNGH